VASPDGSLQLGARGHLGAQPVALPEEEYSGHPALGFSTFVGILVRTSVARATDPPKAEFFIWADDYEWCLRLRRHGELRLVPESRIVHKDAGHPEQTRRGALFNRLFGWSFGPSPYEGFWRNVCGVRNWVWIRKQHFGEGPLGAAVTAARFIAKALMYDDRPFRRIPWIVRAARDGRRGVFVNVTPQEWRERLAR
jgi:GT2 family glycosyltransferase